MNLDNLPSFEHTDSKDCFCNPRVFNKCPVCLGEGAEQCMFCGGKLPVILHNYNEYPFNLRK